MTISYLKGTAGVTGGAGGNVNAALPSGTSSGDVLLYIIHYAGTASFTPPTGWTELYQSPTPQVKGNIAVFIIERGTSAPATLATRTGGANAKGYIYAYPSDIGSLLLINFTAGNYADGTTSLVYDPESVQPGDLVIFAQNIDAAKSITALTATDPAGDAGGTESSSAPTSDQWLIRANEAISASSSYCVHVADGIVASDATTGNINVTVSSNAAYSDGVVIVLREPSGGSGDTITAGEPNVFYEGASGSATITFNGSHTGATDSIRVRIRKAVGGAVVHDWQVLQAAVPAGPFSGSISVARGGWYVVDFDKANDTAVTDTAATSFGVGLAILAMGQSELRNMYQDGTGTVNDRAVTFDGVNWVSVASTAGQARWSLLNDLITAFDCPVASWMLGVGGTSILDWYDSGAGGKQANYNTAEANVIASGVVLSSAIWYQGHGDTASGKTKSDHYTDVGELTTQLRFDYGASLPITIVSLGRNGSGADTGYEPIRDALVDAGNDTNNYTVTTIDLDLQVDNLHPTLAGADVSALRMSRTVQHAYGLVASSRGPLLVSAELVDSTHIRWTVAHDGGADISPATGITGFRVLDGATPVSINSNDRESAITGLITLSSPITGSATLQYGYGAFPDVSAPVVDDTVLALPLQTTDADIAVSVSRTGSISAVESGSDTASIQGLVPVSGIVLVTEQNSDSAVIAGQVSVTGSLLTTEQTQDSSTFLGLVSVSGSMSSSESGSDSPSFSGYLTAPSATGSLNITEQGLDVSSLVGKLLVNGLLSSTESGSDLVSILGDASSAVIGQVVATESGSDISALVGQIAVSGMISTSDQGSDISAVGGQVLIMGIMSAQESGQDSAVISGVSSNNTSGLMSAQEQTGDSASFAGGILITGVMATTDSSDAALVQGLVAVSGLMSIQESGSDTVIITSNLPLVVEVSPFYQRMVDTAYKLIGDKGQGITINRMGVATRGVTTGSFSESVSISWADAQAVILPASKGTIQAFDNRLDMSTLVGKQLRFALVSAKDAPFQPRSLDEVFIGGEKWLVLGCTPLSPTGADIIYKMGLVKA